MILDGIGGADKPVRFIDAFVDELVLTPVEPKAGAAGHTPELPADFTTPGA